MSNSPIIIVFHPHQRPGWAESFDSRDAVVSAWGNGFFDRSCACNNNLSDEESAPTFDNAIADMRHDLNSLTVLESREEFEAYMARGLAGHNRALDSTHAAGVELGWVDEPSEDDED